MLINQVTILFLIIAIGFWARKTCLFNAEFVKTAIDFLLAVTVPFTIVMSFLHIQFSGTVLRNMAIAFGCSVFIHVLAAVFGKFCYWKYSGKTRIIFWFATIFSNSGFMGLPVLESIFGKPGVFYGSIYVVVFNIVVWTLGVYLFERKMDPKTIRKALTNPSIVAVAVGFILFAFSVKLPYPVFKTLDIVGSVTTPFSMLVIGSMMAEIRPDQIFGGIGVYYASFVRLILIPFLVGWLFRLMGVSPDIYRIILVSGAMPVATMTAILAEKYQTETLLASRLVVISTALSIVTIPLILLVF